MSWQEAWEEERTPWDAGAPPPELERMLEEGTLPGGKTLVPGCGSGYDALALAAPDRDVTGLDVADGAAARFDALLADSDVAPRGVRVRTKDFFEFEPSGPFDLVWDYTFLCALEPPRRERWAERMAELIRSGGELVTLLFPVPTTPVDPDEPGDGPPYVVSPGLAEWLLWERFERIEVRPARDSHPAREGAEWVARWRRR